MQPRPIEFAPRGEILGPVIPESLAHKIEAVWDGEGREWLKDFDKILAAACRQWKLTSVVAMPEMSFNFVASARRQASEPVVLKLGVPRDELHYEAEALKVYKGHGAVKLLGHNHDLGAILLERLRPGEPLWTTWTPETDNRHTEIAAGCMTSIWQKATGDFPTTKQWFEAIDKYLKKFPTAGPLPRDLVDQAAQQYKDLESQSDEKYLLHGDLHHGNILSGWNEWKVIDPKGVIGDRAFDAGTWIRNPMDRILKVPDLSEMVHRRLFIISDITGLDLQKLKSWSFCVCVLSACWSTEAEGESFADAIACAEVLR